MQKTYIGTTVHAERKFDLYKLDLGPGDARELLDGMPRNRGIFEPQVSGIARDITNNRWFFGIDLLLFDDNGGILPEAQHRLRAVEKSGKETSFLAIFGHPRSVMDVVGTGRSRTFAQRLRSQGYSNAHQTSSLVNRLWQWDRGNYCFHNGTGVVTATESERQSYLLEHANEIIFAMGTATTKAARGCGVTRVIFHTAAALLNRIDPDDAARFRHLWTTGIALEDGNAILRLRDHLLGETSKKRDATQQLALVCKAWNLWRDGTEVKRHILLPNPLRNGNFPVPR